MPPRFFVSKYSAKPRKDKYFYYICEKNFLKNFNMPSGQYEKPEAKTFAMLPMLSLCQSRGAELFDRKTTTTDGGWDWDDDDN